MCSSERIVCLLDTQVMSFPATLAQNILQKALDNRELVDECYLQLCKHITANPKPDSCVRAWQVMCMAVGTPVMILQRTFLD